MKALILIFIGIILTTITTTQIDPQSGLFIPILISSICILGRGVYEAVQK